MQSREECTGHSFCITSDNGLKSFSSVGFLRSCRLATLVAMFWSSKHTIPLSLLSCLLPPLPNSAVCSQQQPHGCPHIPSEACYWPTVLLRVGVCLVSALQAFLDAEHSNMAELAEQLGSLMTVNESLELVRPMIQEDKTNHAQPGASH